MKRFIKQISIVAALAIWAGSVSALMMHQVKRILPERLGCGYRHICQSKGLIFSQQSMMAMPSILGSDNGSWQKPFRVKIYILCQLKIQI